MKVATLLFTYSRPKHTKLVLDALKKNSILPEKLFVFHDGIKECTNISDWRETERIIKEIDWCNSVVVTASYNRGLADSVIAGVNMAFKEYDAVIVLEDDCVPHRLFMQYMMGALEKYCSKEKVYSIGAFPQGEHVPSNGTDAYFMGRICSWGWATWRDKWNCFKRDYRLLGRIKKNPDLIEWLNIWGQDLEPTIIGDVLGKNDTWAAFWALSVIEKKGLCLIPYKAFVDNIGFDGTGVHCEGKKPFFDGPCNDKNNVILPDKVEVIDNYQHIFSNYFPWTDPIIKERYIKTTLLKWLDREYKGYDLSKWFEIKGIELVSIWGAGDIGTRLIDRLSGVITIDSIIETQPQVKEVCGIKCISPSEIPDYVSCIIVTPGYDLNRIGIQLNQKNREKLIPVDELFGLPFPNIAKNVSVEKEGNDYGGFSVAPDLVRTRGIVYSFGIGEDLSFSEDMLKKFDVSIFAYDPTPKAIHFVKNHELSKNSKFAFFAEGISDKDGMMAFHLPCKEERVSGSCIVHEGLMEDSIEVPMHSLQTILKKNGHSSITVLKLDIEGSEFSVIENLRAKDFVFDQLCVEIHDRFFEDGYERVYRLCKKMIEMDYSLISISDSCEELTFIKNQLLSKENQL
ncbi:FkbM family methyltransferase [Butyrivibrio proteoclasticus]|uniref:FkbM family methyltransferase n=1 Tax=Butyrivibrio proteoclasticus TaxID=43305 RepID=UPI00047E63CD|nr:FkbM family methyltransferase [Butyrivibrio proteoclasticus]